MTIGIYIIAKSNKKEDYAAFSIEKLLEKSDKLYLITNVVSLNSVLLERFKDLGRIEICGLEGGIEETAARIIEKESLAQRFMISSDAYFGPFNGGYEAALSEAGSLAAFSVFDLKKQAVKGLEEIDLLIVNGQGAEALISSLREGGFKGFPEGLEKRGLEYFSEEEAISNRESLNPGLTEYKINEFLEKGLILMPVDCIKPVSVDISEYRHIGKAFDYIKEKCSYDEKMILRYWIRHFEMKDLYENLHWTFVCPLAGEEPPETLRKNDVAIILYLYYDISLDKNLSFLDGCLENGDVYIITKNPKLKEILDQRYPDGKCTVILSPVNRGRDISAFLIESREIVFSHKYVCFVHDKKTSGGSDAETVGDDYNDLIFENLIGSGPYIRRILELFKANELLGVLAGPEVYHGVYFSVLGREWTNNFENTKKLAFDLGITVPMSEDHPPFILSSSFWCRSDAVKRLFIKEWDYEDFPAEPMKMDGTLNHAFERIIIYAAQEEGYFTGTVMNSRYVSAYASNLLSMLKGTLSYLHKNILFQKQSDIWNPKNQDLINFARRQGGNVYIYGTGGNASRVAELLENNDIAINGYIVSDGHLENEIFRGKGVMEFSAFSEKHAHESGIIVSVSKVLQGEIERLLQGQGLENYFCV